MSNRFHKHTRQEDINKLLNPSISNKNKENLGQADRKKSKEQYNSNNYNNLYSIMPKSNVNQSKGLLYGEVCFAIDKAIKNYNQYHDPKYFLQEIIKLLIQMGMPKPRKSKNYKPDWVSLLYDEQTKEGLQ